MANEELKQEISEALKNSTLSRTLGTFCATYPAKREKSYAGVDFEATREGIKRVKSYAADHIDELIDEFTKNCTARGGKVFRATSKEDAIEYVRKLVKERNVKIIVKSKSMASEEIHMNKTLAEDGVLVQETDLGEFIIALEGNTPVHMVMPALHLNKEQVADLFTDYTRQKNAPIIAEEVKTARKVMRQKFTTAEMGVSGANVAVAETGTVFTMTNEGNGRMVGTLPSIHLYVFGIEKLVKSISDASYIFKALPRNGTGQRITSYISLYTGPTEVTVNKETDEKAKKDFYVLILDDPGRREILADPDYRQIFDCIRCGACLDVCPAFALVGGHVYGSKVYTGGIGTLLTNFLISPERAESIQNICLQCGRCKEVCAGGLDITGMILKLRTKFAAESGVAPTYKFALDTVSNRRLFHSLLRIASVAQKPITNGQPMIRNLPLFLSDLTAGRSLPAIAKQPFRDIFPKIHQHVLAPKGTIAIYTGCLLDFVYVDVAEAVVKALNEVGYRVVMPEGQTCCGAPATYMGDTNNAKAAAIMNIEALEAGKYDYIVSACPTCTHSLREYKELFKDDPSMFKLAETLSEKTFDFSKLLHMLGGLPTKGDGKPLKITYHDSCHLRRVMNVYKEPRELLTSTKGVELIEMEDCDRCCGFSGSYSIKFPEISGPILAKKIDNIVKTGADVVAMDCPGCMLQIAGGLDARGLPIKVKHTAQILMEKRKIK